MDSNWKTTESFILLPDLKIITHWQQDKFRTFYKCRKESLFEVCPKCAVKCFSVHDRRWVKIKDHPLRGAGMVLHVLKRRFRCGSCKKVFTEPIQGIRKGFKTTERFRRGVKWACENYKDLKSVQKAFNCSAGLIYRVFYERLEIKLRERSNNPWPTRIGIDEHSWLRGRSGRSFVSLLVDYDNKRVFDAVEGKTALGLTEKLNHIPGRERVKEVALDLCDPFKKFAREMFPNARIVADHFHVVRLLNPALNKARTEITGDKRSHPGRRLLLLNGSRLEYFERKALWQWLDHHPKLKEIYFFKEAIHKLYRTRGYDKASRALTKLTDQMALSTLAEIKTLRRTLMSWRNEILNFFINRTTNARTEGYNNLAKLLQKRAFGFRSFFNYRLRLLSL